MSIGEVIEMLKNIFAMIMEYIEKIFGGDDSETTASAE